MADKEPTKLNDTGITLPKQVRDQMAAAETIREQMNGKEPTNPEIQVADGQKTVEQNTQNAPPAAIEAPQSATEGMDGVGDWEQRFRSLQGRLETERRNNASLVDKVGSLENMISHMQVSGALTEPPPAVQPMQRLVTEQEMADYGDEMLDVVGRRAREAFMPDFSQIVNRLDRIEGRLDGVGNVMARTQQEKVYDLLDAAVPEWQQLNFDQNFKTWLAQEDPFSGEQRQKLLTQAFDRHDANRVVRFFQGFITEATGTPPGQQARAPSAPPDTGSGKPSLVDYAAPGRARSAPQELSPDKPIYTTAAIAKFMADKRTGKFRGREAEADATERDIYLAQHEGRIQ
jgi:hypothetical protein